ncbi:hypothetical protein Pmani_004482 [Petrolisthes manimaculis]|uniref:Uncharacterized protein n=1 Tax=Petrolisthes manimaculis TaxID=1843537 RepID=A0AAE1QEL0_9EUCA|nr:hypothetical protein Pmani_004482 [Petrolisthes manimaculis]
MKILILLAVVGAAFALPQGILGGPRNPAPEGEDSTPDSGRFPFAFPDFFSPRTPGPDGVDGEEPPRSGGFPFGFPDVFSGFPFGPSPGDLPNDYDNSTSVVKDVNGTQMEVNTTTTKQTGEDGNVFYRHFHIVRTIPEDENTDEIFPQEDEAQNEVTSRSRPRRWNEWFKKTAPYIPTPFGFQPYRISSKHPNAIPKGKVEDEQPTRRPGKHIPIRNNADIAVNYISPVPRQANPDAEVFDVNLMREDERRFFEGRDQPVSAQPMLSQPPRSQPIRSQPIRSQPCRSQSLRAQPIRSQPSRSQSLRAQPIRSQSLRAQPIRSQSIRSQPIRSHPLRSYPNRSLPLRSQSLRGQPRL